MRNPVIGVKMWSGPLAPHQHVSAPSRRATEGSEADENCFASHFPLLLSLVKVFLQSFTHSLLVYPIQSRLPLSCSISTWISLQIRLHWDCDDTSMLIRYRSSIRSSLQPEILHYPVEPSCVWDTSAIHTRVRGIRDLLVQLRSAGVGQEQTISSR